MDLPIRTRACTCPKCDYKLDAATPVTDPNSVPKPGDLSICINCGVALTFTEDLTLKVLDDEEISQLPEDAKNELFQGMVAVGLMIKRRNRGH